MAIIAPAVEPACLRYCAGVRQPQRDEADLEVERSAYAALASVTFGAGTLRTAPSTDSAMLVVRVRDALGGSFDPAPGTTYALTANAALALGLRSESGPETLSLDTFVDGALVPVVTIRANSSGATLLESVAFTTNLAVPAPAAAKTVEAGPSRTGVQVGHVFPRASVLVAAVGGTHGVAGVYGAFVVVAAAVMHRIVDAPASLCVTFVGCAADLVVTVERFLDELATELAPTLPDAVAAIPVLTIRVRVAGLEISVSIRVGISVGVRIAISIGVPIAVPVAVG